MTWRSDERGSVAVETAVIAPALVALLLLVVFAGRVAQAEGDVRRAASEAARAASLAGNPDGATTAAIDTAAANLTASGVACGDLDTTVDTTDFAPGGSVAVTVRCVASMADVSLLGVPGQRTFESRSVEIIDRYRSEAGP
jgi:Flp pilus assembly protein TadG